MSNETHVQHTWSYDPDDFEVRNEYDGTVLFDVHNATDDDARLIAAAPDLLRAAQWMLDHYAEPACMFGQAHHDTEACASCFAHAAIRKATGE